MKTPLTPSRAKAAVRRHLNKINSSCNVTQFTAQLYESEAVELLISFARDITIPPAVRRQAAVDIITAARGTPKPWFVDPQTIDPAGEGKSGFGASVAQEIAAATLSAGLYKQLNELTAKNIHPSAWPPEVRAIATDMILYYQDEDEDNDNAALLIQ